MNWREGLSRFWSRTGEVLPPPLMPDSASADAYWMLKALQQARQAEAEGEVPVGAVLVKGEYLLAQGHNQPIRQHDPTAHAEMQVLRLAGRALKNYRLNDTTLYVTLEPCAMCMTALVHARVKRLVFGADDPVRGAVISALQLAEADFLNHRILYQGGVMAQESGDLLKRFFRSKRVKSG